MNASSGAAAAGAERLLGGVTASGRPYGSRLPRFYARPASGFQLPRRILKMNGGRISCSSSGDGGKGLTYKDAGVDIDAGTELVRRIAKMTPGIGGFGGLYPLGDSYLVASTDGVGTKLKLAFETGIHDTIGIDLVAMSVNDIVTSGAKPLFFLDYFGTSHLDVDLAEKVIKGIVDGCKQSDCVLLGGETAEMPDFYAKGEYDLSGFAVGIVKKDSLIDGKSIKSGDILIGFPSSGVHSNGFSLVRRVLAQSGLSLSDQFPGHNGGPFTLGEALMAPTVIYVKQVLDIISKGGVKGIAHITGGGFTDNIPRVFPPGLGANIFTNSWDAPAVFNWLQQAGRIDDAEMRRTFNMGIGLVVVVTPEASERILADYNSLHRIGVVVNGEGVKPKENVRARDELEKAVKLFWETGLPSPRCVAVDAVVEDELAEALQVSIFPELIFTKAGKILHRDKVLRTADELSKMMAFFYYKAVRPPCLDKAAGLNQEKIPSFR